MLIIRLIKQLWLKVVIAGVIVGLCLAGIYAYVGYSGSKWIMEKSSVKNADAIIVLGAYVFPNGKVSDMLADRLDIGAELYFAKKAPKIIVSGDHGRASYDEVNNMRKYLQAKGIKREDIFMDHAGFDTYDSMYRARAIFQVNNAIVVTQTFHLKRALYIAHNLGINAYGVNSDNHAYPGILYNDLREVGSRCKALLQAGILHPRPRYLGKVIPISGSGILTDDGK